MGMLADPRARRAYVLTKLAVFALAALATWPLSRIIGPEAWIGLAVFGVLLLALGAVVLAAGGRPERVPVTPPEPPDDDGHDDPDPERPVTLPVEDSLDLHPFQPREIPDVVWDYVDAAHAEGHRVVRLIHGRGIGVQRERVRSTLEKHPLVASFDDAPPGRGGWGAQEAHLRDSPDS